MVVRVLVIVVMVVMGVLVHRRVHHLQHRDAAAAAEVPPRERCGDEQEEDVQV
jgi:hypothetical protein